jgi:hypothetical protein
MAYVLMKLYHARTTEWPEPCPHSPIPGVPTTKKTLGRGYPVPYFKDSPATRTLTTTSVSRLPGPLSFLNSSEFVDLHRTVPRSRWTAGHFRILIFLPRGEEAMKKKWRTFFYQTYLYWKVICFI